MPAGSSLLLLRPSLFWCCFDMSNPEDTQTTEASQESQDSQKSSRNKETTRSTADCLQWAIGEGIGDHLSLTDSQGESQNGRLNCNLCAVWLSTKGAILKDHVLGKNVNNRTVRTHGNLGHMLVKLLFAQLHHLRKRKEHLNSRLLLLSMFLPHNLNLHQLPRKRQQRVPLFWGRCFKRAPHCRSFRRTSPGHLVLQMFLWKSWGTWR